MRRSMTASDVFAGAEDVPIMNLDELFADDEAMPIRAGWTWFKVADVDDDDDANEEDKSRAPPSHFGITPSRSRPSIPPPRGQMGQVPSQQEEQAKPPAAAAAAATAGADRGRRTDAPDDEPVGSLSAQRRRHRESMARLRRKLRESIASLRIREAELEATLKRALRERRRRVRSRTTSVPSPPQAARGGTSPSAPDDRLGPYIHLVLEERELRAQNAAFEASLAEYDRYIGVVCRGLDRTYGQAPEGDEDTAGESP